MTQQVRLAKIKEFSEALENYRISEHAQKILNQTELVILLGVFGSGRNSIIRELENRGNYRFIVSDTTRPPKVRDGALEQHGVQYFFRSEDDVLRDIKNGEFLEAEIIHNQQVSGISIRELKNAQNSGRVPINEVDLQGAVNILEAKPDAKLIFVVPPSFDEWQRRLRQREVMDEQEFENRMQTAQKILRTILSNDSFHFVINDAIVQAADRVDEIVRSGRHSQEHNEEAKVIAARLLEQIDSQLAASTLDD
jgi:guanylate kinase